jgi:hypothetical protein
VVVLAVAALALGACGASSKSATSVRLNTTSTTRAASTPVTDLNGHVVLGVKAKDIQAESQPYQPLDAATNAVLTRQLDEARTVAMRYPTVADATAAGYFLVGGGFGPGSGAHYVNYHSFGSTFDPNHPLALVYDGIHPGSKIVGLMYYSMNTTAPSGFAGPNDHWHRHSGVCIGTGGSVLFPPDSDVTARQCLVAKGNFMAITGWMVHAWVVPGWSSPDGVFSHENPKLTCADGTFNTDAIGRCQGT